MDMGCWYHCHVQWRPWNSSASYDFYLQTCREAFLSNSESEDAVREALQGDANLVLESWQNGSSIKSRMCLYACLLGPNGCLHRWWTLVNLPLAKRFLFYCWWRRSSWDSLLLHGSKGVKSFRKRKNIWNKNANCLSLRAWTSDTGDAVTNRTCRCVLGWRNYWIEYNSLGASDLGQGITLHV